MPRIAIVVGEASGDQLARGLIQELRARRPDAEFVGITGPHMRAAGCQSWGDFEQLAVMGLVEVIRHLPVLRRLMKSLRARLRDDPPDILIGIDAPDFNLRLEAYARQRGIPTVHYVCPSVWAWRKGRTKTIRKSCDLVLCLLPFEKDFLDGYGVPSVFVGHPLADEIGDGLDRAESRRILGLPDAPLLALLPGSRRSEIEHLGRLFLQVAVRVGRSVPGMRCVVAAANAAVADRMRGFARDLQIEDAVDVRIAETRNVLGAANSVLVASGTATLETMLMRRPMVVAYKANPFTVWLGRWLVDIEFFALPNLLAKKLLVPEFLQEEATSEALAEAVIGQLATVSHQQDMLSEFESLADSLRCSASQRAADAVLALLDNRSMSA